MAEERDKSSRAGESVARTTARDVPFTRGVESEPAPEGQRPAQLPRDPSYEAELAQVDLAVLRDPERRAPSTKQAGRRGQSLPGQPPESVTPESPGTRSLQQVASGQSPEPPSSGGRAVASGTLLSVGAVDPRGKTERTLETPRMFISQQETVGEAYFKPGKIPAVTVHQTLETETVKLSDSIDPRRAKTIPRLDRAVLAQLAGSEAPESAAPLVISGPGSSVEVGPAADSAQWDQYELAVDPPSLPSNFDGQIHASLSQFREGPASDYEVEGAATRAEPFAARRASDAPEAVSSARPDASTIPTQRDLPAHRIEASQPPPAPVGGVAQPRSSSVPDSDALDSEGPRPTTASIASAEPDERRPVWINYLAFAAALLLAVVVGLFLTRKPESRPATDATRTPAPVEAVPSAVAAPVELAAPPEVVAPAAPQGEAAKA